MRVAVFLTGALRTIDKTISYFKRNLLLSSEYHVYACLQNDTDKSNQEIEDWLKLQIGDHLKSIQWINPNQDYLWIALRERLLENINVSEDWKAYLRNSGSMIEYYQLQSAYLVMSKIEIRNRFRYNYVIRCRTDTIFTKPIDFKWLHWDNNFISERFELFMNLFTLYNIEKTNENVLKYFMTTLLYSNTEIVDNFTNIQIDNMLIENDRLLQEYLKQDIKSNEIINSLQNYVNYGHYALTFRCNLLYIIHRDMFNIIPSLGSFYGYFMYPTSDPHWFNAECQFRGACYQSGVSYFDYQTNFESSSLYHYKKDNYFDSDYNLKTNLMLFCLVRN